MASEIVCPHCSLEFESHSLKANHIRWKHKQPGFTAAGKQELHEKLLAANVRRFGEKLVLELECEKCHERFVFKTRERSAKKRPAHCSKRCANSHVETDESRANHSKGMKTAMAANPALREQFMKNLTKGSNKRCSSKAERALCELLKPLGFKRHMVVKSASGLMFEVDVMSADKHVWIESDGSWHFRKVHDGHDFEKVQLRDATEEAEAITRGVLLIRVNNEKFKVAEQEALILRTIAEWDGKTGTVIKHW